MSEESNVCPICGGVKRIEYVIGFEEGPPRDMSVKAPEPLPEGGWRLCPGHPEPVPEHDGKLDGYEVGYGSEWDVLGIRIKASDSSVVGNDVFLVPHRALSLLAWLKQEEPKLQRLAKEQGF